MMRTVEWVDGKVRMIDQRALPWELRFIDFDDYLGVSGAIQEMVVRGAPAIGAAGAFGLALAAQAAATKEINDSKHLIADAAHILVSARPTAINLKWAVDRLLHLSADKNISTADDLFTAMLHEAQLIADEDIAINKRMAAYGATLIKDGDTILHHCNTGALATVDWGTALGVIRTAHEQGKNIHVLLDETRPRLQGARLSAWELKQANIPFDIIADNAAGYFMLNGDIDIVLVGSDRTASNGDVANKIGTYKLAVIAKENGIPFYPVVPTSTIDLSIPSGKEIPIEERDGDEIRAPYGLAVVPSDYPVRNPAFDVTPYRYVTGIITENGLVYPPFIVNLARAVRGETVTA